MTDEPRDQREQPPRTAHALSRARFLGFLGGGALLGLTGKRALGLLGGWRFNTVERPVPEFDSAAYRLVVDGHVERPFTLTYDELRTLPSVRQVSDFHCVEGWGVDDVRWDGVRLQAIIERARPTEQAKFLTFHSMGGIYRDSLSMRQAMSGDTLIAYDMDGEPLSRSHGLPLRLVMPQMFGYKGPKWLTRIEFRSGRDFGFWEQRGWAVDAWIKT
ncbi:MAG: molybdopterin-dependent oxidoreductase [Dehalococcoidia bacterium]